MRPGGGGASRVPGRLAVPAGAHPEPGIRCSASAGQDIRGCLSQSRARRSDPKHPDPVCAVTVPEAPKPDSGACLKPVVAHRNPGKANRHRFACAAGLSQCQHPHGIMPSDACAVSPRICEPAAGGTCARILDWDGSKSRQTYKDGTSHHPAVGWNVLAWRVADQSPFFTEISHIGGKSNLGLSCVSHLGVGYNQVLFSTI